MALLHPQAQGLDSRGWRSAGSSVPHAGRIHGGGGPKLCCCIVFSCFVCVPSRSTQLSPPWQDKMPSKHNRQPRRVFVCKCDGVSVGHWLKDGAFLASEPGDAADGAGSGGNVIAGPEPPTSEAVLAFLERVMLHPRLMNESLAGEKRAPARPKANDTPHSNTHTPHPTHNRMIVCFGTHLTHTHTERID